MQTKWMLSGSSYPRLDENDFLSIEVVIPQNLKEQEEILKSIGVLKEKYESFKFKAKELRKEAEQTFERLLLS
jgi:restriction endonuclease S subunit